MSRDFQGKTAFVTGAASGIGLTTALALADRGANVTTCRARPTTPS